MNFCHKEPGFLPKLTRCKFGVPTTYREKTPNLRRYSPGCHLGIPKAPPLPWVGPEPHWWFARLKRPGQQRIRKKLLLKSRELSFREATPKIRPKNDLKNTGFFLGGEVLLSSTNRIRVTICICYMKSCSLLYTFNLRSSKPKIYPSDGETARGMTWLKNRNLRVHPPSPPQKKNEHLISETRGFYSKIPKTSHGTKETKKSAFSEDLPKQSTGAIVFQKKNGEDLPVALFLRTFQVKFIMSSCLYPPVN